MKRIMITLRPVLVILTLLLFLSSVLAQSTAYDLSRWSVDGGGATFSIGGNYKLGGTIGQPDAGQISGGTYILGGGFWGGGTAPHGGPTYLPLIAIASAPLPPPPCNDVEDNDDQISARLLTTVNQACRGSLEDDPIGPPGDDYYWLDLATGKHISIDLTDIPVGADYSLALFRFDPPDQLPRVGFSDQPGNTAEHVEYLSLRTTRYYIRLRKNVAGPTVDIYTLRVIVY